MKTGAWLFSFLFVAICWPLYSACNAEEVDERVLEKVAELKTLWAGDYEHYRFVLLRQENVAEKLEALRKATDDWHVETLCEAFLYRIRNPKKAALIDRKWGRALTSNLRGGPVIGEYGSVLAIHFGTDAGSLVAETLLHRWIAEPLLEQDSALYALKLLRYKYTPEVALESTKYGAEFKLQLHALATVGECLKGLPERSLSVRATNDYFSYPLELEEYRQDRTLPAFALEGERRTAVVEALAALLDSVNIPLAARAAYELRNEPTPGVVAHLLEKMKSPASAWVRAYCADSLRHIDTEAAHRALKEAREVEKNPEVIEVVEGRRRPKWDWSGTEPTGAILAPEK